MLNWNENCERGKILCPKMQSVAGLILKEVSARRLEEGDRDIKENGFIVQNATISVWPILYLGSCFDFGLISY
tara:strand:- start:3344 stop:3562 length:219 start_codon:yes stop_codon:yes gene_type:complete